MAGAMDRAGSPIGDGIYTLSEVARLTGSHYQRIHSWFLGRSEGPGPILDRAQLRQKRDLLRPRVDLTVSFHSLIDALVVSKLREYGVSLQYLRKVYNALSEQFSQQHPFSQSNLYTDGKEVFVRFADKFGYEALMELLTNQQSFPPVLEDYLTQIDYDEDTLLAIRWRIAEGIVIDPRRRYGKPIVATCGVPTVILAAAYKGNDQDVDLVAEWYGVSQLDVTQAVDFEKSLLSEAA